MVTSPPFTGYSKMQAIQKASKMVSPMRCITSQDSANNDSELPLVTEGNKLTPRQPPKGIKLVLEQNSPSMTSPPELTTTALKAQSPTDEKLKPQAIIEQSNEKTNKSGDVTTEFNSPDRRFNSPDRKSSIK